MESDNLLLLAIAFCGLSLIFGGLFWWVRQEEKSQGQSGDSEGVAVANPAGDPTGLRRRRVGHVPRVEEDVDILAGLDPTSKKYKKLEAKMAKKLAKEEARERRKAEQETKAKKLSNKEREYQKREEQREQKERIEAEDRERLKQDEEEKEKEEYDQWKDMFETSDAGAGPDNTSSDRGNVMLNLLAHILRMKVIVIEDLVDFDLNGEDAFDRVQTLVQMGRLTGVIDDRGKFMHITPKEMRNVSSFIHENGRVSMSALAKQSNKLIDLEESIISPQNSAATGSVPAAFTI